jgi:hypothetical protein
LNIFYHDTVRENQAGLYGDIQLDDEDLLIFYILDHPDMEEMDADHE